MDGRLPLESAPNGSFVVLVELMSDSPTSESLLAGRIACLFWGAETSNPNSPLEVNEED